MTAQPKGEELLLSSSGSKERPAGVGPLLQGAEVGIFGVFTLAMVCADQKRRAWSTLTMKVNAGTQAEGTPHMFTVPLSAGPFLPEASSCPFTPEV